MASASFTTTTSTILHRWDWPYGRSSAARLVTNVQSALLPVIPSKEEFPYTIRVIYWGNESNGSSSMASTCGSTLSLMDTGVPLKRPCFWCCNGSYPGEQQTVVLTDIQGLEDFLSDMDFKVTRYHQRVLPQCRWTIRQLVLLQRFCAAHFFRLKRAACSF